MLPSEGRGRGFESRRVRHLFNGLGKHRFGEKLTGHLWDTCGNTLREIGIAGVPDWHSIGPRFMCVGQPSHVAVN